MRSGSQTGTYENCGPPPAPPGWTWSRGPFDAGLQTGGVVGRPEGGRNRARTPELQAPAELVAAEDDQVVCLVERRQPLLGAWTVDARAPGQRVGDPAEEAVVRLVRELRLRADHVARAVVRVAPEVRAGADAGP